MKYLQPLIPTIKHQNHPPVSATISTVCQDTQLVVGLRTNPTAAASAAPLSVVERAVQRHSFSEPTEVRFLGGRGEGNGNGLHGGTPHKRLGSNGLLVVPKPAARFEP